MSKEIEVCEGATISAAEVERVEKAMEKLAEDKGASHQVTVTVTLRIHHEYPKTLYKGKEVKVVEDSDAEKAAIKDGFGPLNHRTFTGGRV